MSWRDDAQRGAVARALLAMVYREDLWTEAGPTRESVGLVQSGGGYLSTGEAVALRLAFDVWNGEGDLKVADLFDAFDPRRLEAVGALLMAMARGASAVDAWLEVYGAGG